MTLGGVSSHGQFFKEMNIHQGGDCCGMWHILKLKGFGKCLSGVEHYEGSVKPLLYIAVRYVQGIGVIL